MKIFLDTSSLIKLYHVEVGTSELVNMFSTTYITGVFLSEISRLEFTSAIWKKVRIKAITEAEAKRTLDIFKHDLEKYTFIPIDSLMLEEAKMLLTKYGATGLRTLDSIQLAAAISIKNKIDKYFTADNLLLQLFKEEGLAI